MSDINWQENAVCYGDGRHWFANTDYESDKFELVNNDGTRKYSLYGILNFPKDFQLNEIVTGDFIPASELDTEQKYNDAVEVLKLHGVTGGLINRSYQVASALNDGNDERFVIHKTSDGELCFGVVPSDSIDFCKRKLTYHQIIAIGKLKRMMLERENVERQSSYCRCKQVEFGESKLPKFNVETPMPEVKEPKKHKPIVAQVMVDLMERMEVGIKTYGEALRPNNGRDALQDAYEEALDLACYLKQAMIEREQAND